MIQRKAAELGPLPKKAKVIMQKLDPNMFHRKSRFDQAPKTTKSEFATGANATPLGKTPTMVLNKYSISRFVCENFKISVSEAFTLFSN